MALAPAEPERDELGVEHARRGTPRPRAGGCARRAAGPWPRRPAVAGAAARSRAACPVREARPRRRGVCRRTRARRAPPSRCGLRPTRGCRRAGRRSRRVRGRGARASPSTPPTSTASSGRASAQAGEDQVVAEPVAFVLRRLARLELEQELAGFARDVGRELVVVHSVRRRLVRVVDSDSDGRGGEQRCRRPAQHARVDRLHEREVDVGATRR